MYRIAVAFKVNPVVTYTLADVADMDFALELIQYLINTRLYSRIILMEVNNE